MSSQNADPNARPDLRTIIARMKVDYPGDRELIRQLVADLNGQDRSALERNFEARREYTKQVAELRQNARQGIVSYGLQTLRWLFLQNAGAITVVLAYIGTAVGKLNSASLSQFAGLLTSLWPFAVGCVLVVFAGAAGFLNFLYDDALYPGPEGLHNFLNPSSRKWPLARLQEEDETPQDFQKRFGWKADVTRNAAIFCAIASALAFGVGVFLIFRAAAVVR